MSFRHESAFVENGACITKLNYYVSTPRLELQRRLGDLLMPKAISAPWLRDLYYASTNTEQISKSWRALFALSLTIPIELR